MQVKDHELASRLIKGEAVEFPPSKSYARLVDPAARGATATEGGGSALARIWVLPQKRGGVRLMLRTTSPEPPKDIRDAGFTREAKSGYAQLTTDDEKVARKFIAWARGVIEKAAAATPAAKKPAASRKKATA
jgi:hypothetical protein